MQILALDVASRMGVAAGAPGERPRLSAVNLSREFDSHADIFCRALRWVTLRLSEEPPDLVVLEQPLLKHDSSMLFGLRGVMFAAVCHHGIKWLEVSPPTWRKYFVGKGHLKGPEAKARAVALCARLGWGDALDHNAAEAAGMWLWGCAQVAPREVPRHEPLFLGGQRYGAT